MTRAGACALLFSSVCALPQGAAAQSKTADEVIEMIDALVFHVERQEGVNGYTATVVERYDATLQDGAEAKGEVQAKGRLEVDAVEKKRTLTLEGGETRDLGAFRPSCGPWGLATVMALETQLFTTPLAEQFPAAEFDRFIARRSGGFALRLKPKSPIGENPQPFRPVITSISIHTDANGLPTSGELALDMQLMESKAKLDFTFDEVAGKQRLRTIRNEISMANLGIKPTLTFEYVEVETVILPRTISFGIAAEDLSPTMAQMVGSFTTKQAYDDHRVVHATPPIPDDWTDVSAFYLRRMMGEPLPGEDIAALLPEPTKPAKDKKIGGVRRRMYLPHGLRLAFDSDDRLVEALIRVKPGNGFGAFVGELAEGVTADSTRGAIEGQFGKPAATKNSSKTTTVSYPARGLDIIYEGKKAGETAPVVAIVLRPEADGK